MKIVAKRILAFLIFLILVFAVYGYAMMVFLPKNEQDLGGSKYYGYIDFKYEVKNTIDVIVCGNSDAYSGFSPLELYNQTGITSYVRSASRESVNNIESIIKDTLKQQKPKVVIIDVDCLFDANRTFTGTSRQKYLPLIAPIYFHSRWKELTFKDFVTIPKPQESVFKGYVYETEIYDYRKPNNYMENLNQAPQPIQQSVLKSFKNIVKICKKNDIKLNLVCFPTPKSWSNGKSNAVQNLADEYNLPFLDLNLNQNGYELDYSSSFRDKGNHLNFYGATYTTRYLSNVIKDNYTDLVDHRSDEKYSSWNKLLPFYENLLKSKGIAV